MNLIKKSFHFRKVLICYFILIIKFLIDLDKQNYFSLSFSIKGINQNDFSFKEIMMMLNRYFYISTKKGRIIKKFIGLGKNSLNRIGVI
jgi:hypothetical protein